MSIYITNITEEIIKCDTVGVIITPGQTVELNNDEQLEAASRSSQLISYLATNRLVANDGIKNLSLEEAVHALAKTTVISGPRDKSNKLRVHQTSRALGTTTCFTGVGDDPSDPSLIGNGAECVFHHKIGDENTSYYVDFNIIENDTYIHEAYITWSDCKYDKVTCDIVPIVTPLVAGENTNFSLYGGYLVVPAMGNGTINPTSDLTDPRGGLIQMPPNDLGKIPTAYWNASYNPAIKKFEDIQYAMGDGIYNIFAAEVPIFRIFNSVPLLGSGFQELRTSDTAQLGHGMRFKISCETYGEDHEWGFAFTFVLHRLKSI